MYVDKEYLNGLEMREVIDTAIRNVSGKGTLRVYMADQMTFPTIKQHFSKYDTSYGELDNVMGKLPSIVFEFNENKTKNSINAIDELFA